MQKSGKDVIKLSLRDDRLVESPGPIDIMQQGTSPEIVAGDRDFVVAWQAFDASDSARGFFEKRGYVAQQRNTVLADGEWLANTTLHKELKGSQLAAKREAS